MIRTFLLRAAGALVAVAFATAAAAEDASLVIDASGSMWGQINKEAKITIAKRALADIVAAALEKAGADFVVHVVGFDVKEENEQAQLRCIAENTGGRFLTAANAGELVKALETTVVQAPAAPAGANLFLRATELAGGLVIEEGLVWSVTPAAGGGAVVSETNAGNVDATVAPGTYDVAVERPADGLKGAAKGVALAANAQKTVTIALEFPVSATVRVEPAASAVAGSTIKVHWTGPNRSGDFISIATKDAKPGETETYAYAKAGAPSELRLPVASGTYEVRYVLGHPYRVLATAEVMATPAAATLTAPDVAISGAEVGVAFTGPPAGSGDFVTITKPEDPDNKYMDYAYSKQGSPAKLRMPLEPGTYEFRFVQNNTKVLARTGVTVTAAEATVSAPATAAAGAEVAVEFTGPPAGSGDYITVTDVGAPSNKYTDYAYTKNGSPAKLKMPLEAGVYEIRYVQGNTKVIASRKITVSAVEASVKAKASAIAGETVKVEFTGPAGSGDFITVTEPSAPDNQYKDYIYTKNGSPGELRLPLEAGTYEIRFVQGNSKVLARQTIVATAATATLSAPASAPAGSTVSVAFTGPPPGSGDYVTVVEAGAPDSRYLDYAYSTNGSPAQIKMPMIAGDYEIRFIQGNKYVLARKPIKVTTP